MQECLLCTELGGRLAYKNDLFRIVVVDDTTYPGFVRLIAKQHIKEMTDLNADESNQIMAAVLKIELVIRRIYKPDKINLASLGNVVPHVHWHIIPRYLNDKHYPNPIWGEITHADYTPSSSIKNLNQELITQLTKIII